MVGARTVSKRPTHSLSCKILIIGEKRLCLFTVEPGLFPSLGHNTLPLALRLRSARLTLAEAMTLGTRDAAMHGGWTARERLLGVFRRIFRRRSIDDALDDPALESLFAWNRGN
jgi:hypothetical protein